jgi:hypothetical protein
MVCGRKRLLAAPHRTLAVALHGHDGFGDVGMIKGSNGTSTGHEPPDVDLIALDDSKAQTIDSAASRVDVPFVYRFSSTEMFNDSLESRLCWFSQIRPLTCPPKANCQAMMGLAQPLFGLTVRLTLRDRTDHHGDPRSILCGHARNAGGALSVRSLEQRSAT